MTNSGTDNKKPWVVVLGGCGFIGRNLVEYLVRKDVVSGVRVVDKVPPQMAWLNKNHLQIFNDPRVEFVSANLINPSSCANALTPRENITTWDLVVNCAGETKVGQTDPVYQEGILKLSLNCAKECAKLKVHRYIEISSACVYSTSKNSNKEDDSLNPWTIVSKWKFQVEEEIKQLAKETELNYTILRPAIVYGKGDRKNLTPRLMIGAIYARLGEVMKLMWGPDLGMNTVHVWDLCSAVWFIGRKGECRGQVYHVVDNSNSTQGSITTQITNIFNINIDYLNTAMSHLAKSDLTSVLEDLNDKHLTTWASACSTEGIENTPLDPTMSEEMLSEKHLSLDGSKLKELGFTCEYPFVTVDKLKEVINDYIEMGIFPKCLMQ